MKPYFYVYRPLAKGPTVKHPTREAAQQEALRLAARHPGVAFEILQCIGISQTAKANTFWMDEDEPKGQTIRQYQVFTASGGTTKWYDEGTGPMADGALWPSDRLEWREIHRP